MAGPGTLDACAALRLAGLDPALRLLPQALPPSWTAAPYTLHDLQWEPGARCRLVVRIGDPDRGRAVRVRRRAARRLVAARLPRRRRAAGPVARRGPRARPGPAGAWLDGPARRCRVEAVRYRPGSRCVLRYHVQTGPTWTSLYAKVLAPDRFAEAARVQRALTSPVDDRPLLVPRLVSVWPGLQTLVGEAVGGRSVSSLLAEPGTTAGESSASRTTSAPCSPPSTAGVPPRPAGGRRPRSSPHLASMLPAARICDAATAGRVAGLLDLLDARLPAASPEVLAHGGFRAGQVVFAPGGRLVVLDTDGARRGDPCADLGTALAHLRWQAVRLPGRRATLLRAEQALLAGYGGRAGAADPRALAWWHAAGLLQVALRRYRRLEVDQWERLPELVDAASDLLTDRRPGTSTPAGTDPLDVRQMTRVLSGAVTGRGEPHGPSWSSRPPRSSRRTAGAASSGTPSAGSTAPLRCRWSARGSPSAVAPDCSTTTCAGSTRGRSRTDGSGSRPPSPWSLPWAWSSTGTARGCRSTGSRRRRVRARCATGRPVAGPAARLRRTPPADLLPGRRGAEHPGVGDAHRGPAPPAGRAGGRPRARLGRRGPVRRPVAGRADPQGLPPGTRAGR